MQTAIVLDGVQTAAAYREKISAEVGELAKKGITPGLAVVLIGDNPASASYVKGKQQACEEIGIRTFDFKFPASMSEGELLGLIKKLNGDTAVHGILVQLPLPAHISEQKVIEAILPEKDVDGFHPVNVGRMLLGQECFLPCTPNGIIKMLEHWGLKTQGKHVVVCGRSAIVGKPVANMLLQKGPFADATVTICHSKTPNLAAHTLQADILIAAMGQAEFIRGDMIKQGAVVIDVGVNRIPDETKKSGFRLVGDVRFNEAMEKASYVTPVPKGVGPMTITMLLANTALSARRVLESSKRV